MSYKIAEKKKFRISTDAVTTEVQAIDEDEAASKFAANENGFNGCICVSDLIFRAKQMGGWCNVEEI